MAAIKRCFKCKKGKRSHGGYCRPCGNAYRKAWARKNRHKSKEHRAKNKEKIAASKRIYYQTNAAEIKASVRKYRKKNLERLKAWDRKDRAARPEVVFFKNARLRAQRKNLAFTITVEDVKKAYDVALASGVCPYLAIPFVFNTVGSKRRVDGSPSLDRINPTLGYSPSNIEIISWRANHVKSDATPDELITVGQRLLALAKKEI